MTVGGHNKGDKETIGEGVRCAKKGAPASSFNFTRKKELKKKENRGLWKRGEQNKPERSMRGETIHPRKLRWKGTIRADKTGRTSG